MIKYIVTFCLLACSVMGQDTNISGASGGGGGTTLTDSASLRSALSDENGTGAALFSGATSPTFITPALGTPSALVLTNATGLPESGVTNLTSDLALKAPLASPTFTGTVTTPNITLSGNQSAAAWTTSGLRLVGVAGTLTDTTSSGTVAAAYTNKLGGNTIAASSATTFTNYISGYFSDPIAGTNVTLTNKYALGADSLSVGTSTPLTVSTGGDLSIGGGDLTLTGTSTITGGAGNMTITSGTGNSRTMTLQTTTSGGTATNALVLDASQNITVGGGTINVGTSATQISRYTSNSANDGTLISGASTGAVLGIKDTNVNGFSGIEYINNSGATAVFTGYNNAGSGEFRFNNISSGGFIVFKIASTDALTIYNSRGVGIGTTDPGAGKLIAANGVFSASTVTAAGTTGAQTINKSRGTVRFAAAATTLVVTDSLVVSTSKIIARGIGAFDATATNFQCTAGSGSFTITANAAATSETEVIFDVLIP